MRSSVHSMMLNESSLSWRTNTDDRPTKEIVHLIGIRDVPDTPRSLIGQRVRRRHGFPVPKRVGVAARHHTSVSSMRGKWKSSGGQVESGRDIGHVRITRRTLQRNLLHLTHESTTSAVGLRFRELSLVYLAHNERFGGYSRRFIREYDACSVVDRAGAAGHDGWSRVERRRQVHATDTGRARCARRTQGIAILIIQDLDAEG